MGGERREHGGGCGGGGTLRNFDSGSYSDAETDRSCKLRKTPVGKAADVEESDSDDDALMQLLASGVKCADEDDDE
jgi:hypothetical protein